MNHRVLSEKMDHTRGNYSHVDVCPYMPHSNKIDYGINLIFSNILDKYIEKSDDRLSPVVPFHGSF
jgi:hypothetical protein